jgi:transposase
MQEEELLLKQRDRDFLKVLHEVRRGHITQRQAAEQLKVTDRWIRRLLGRIREKGDRAVIHGLRGRPSQRRISEKVRKRAVEIVAREYADFGPTLAAEYLTRDHGIAVSRETLRQWMIRAGLWKKRKQRIAEIHVWRRRRSCYGELVQWDTSDHDWLEGRGERIYLIAMIDDATSRVVARFAPQDSTAENMRLLWTWVERHGRFVEAYTDRAGLFETNRPNQRDEERQGKLAETQIGRALRELRIGWIAARSPQAKGRIERFFKTAQDRLVKGMRKARVCTREQANAYLEQSYLPLWNERFTVRPAAAVDAHRPLDKDQDLGSISEPRRAARDRARLHHAVRRSVVSAGAGTHPAAVARPSGACRAASGRPFGGAHRGGRSEGKTVCSRRDDCRAAESSESHSAHGASHWRPATLDVWFSARPQPRSRRGRLRQSMRKAGQKRPGIFRV